MPNSRMKELFTAPNGRRTNERKAMNDDEIIELFFARSERAIAETQAKYGRYCRYIADAILDDEESAKECENDTYLGLWNSIPPNRPPVFKAYVGAICRKTALDRLDERLRQKRGGRAECAYEELAEIIAAADDFPDEIALRELLNEFLSTLGREARIIFLQRYWYMRSVKEIAADRATSESAVKTSLHRSREKLKRYLRKEGYTI